MEIKEIAQNINVLCDNMVDEVAIINMLNAKLMHLMAFKGVTFESIDNLDRPMPPTYYAFNFVPSGGLKNKLLMEIDRLMPFCKDIIKKYNDYRFKELELRQYEELRSVSGAEEKALQREHKLEKKAFKELYWTVSDATQASIYNSMEIISTTGYGSMFLENTEFANYFEDAFVNKDKNKKEFLDMLFNLYDGEFAGTNTMTTARKNIKGVSLSAGFMSDYKLIVESSNISKAFKSYLIRGMARRSFIYFSDKMNCYKESVNLSSFAERENAINYLKHASLELQMIYDKVKQKGKYSFNSEANEYIRDYKTKVYERIREFYRDTDYLDDDSEILKLTVQHSTWKLIKLAVLYHLLENPESILIKVDSFIKAQKFFEAIYPCLESMVTKNTMSEYDKLYAFLVRNKNKWIAKSELRNQKFVSNKEFGNWIEGALQEGAEKCAKKGLIMQARVAGSTNRGYEIVIYDPKVYQFNKTEDIEGIGVKGELKKIDNSDRFLVEI